MGRFSLTQLYRRSSFAKVFDYAILTLILLLIVLVPLPFGSVEVNSVFRLEFVAGVIFFLWMLKLIFCANPDELEKFQSYYEKENEDFKKAPFFHRWPALAFMMRLATLGRYPQKYEITNFADEQNQNMLPRLTFYSVFGFPVRKTGVEIFAILFLLFLCFQIVPLPHFVTQILSPASAELYASAYRAAGERIGFHSLSLDAFATFTKILEYSAYFMIYLVIVNGAPSRPFYRIVLGAFIFAVAFQSIYGLAEFVTGHQHIFAYKKTVNTDYATGTFIDRNHYAVYLEMALPLLFGFIAGFFYRNRKRKESLFTRISYVLQAEGGKCLLYIFFAAVAALGIICSMSRSGILFAFASCFLFFVLYIKSIKHFSRGFFVFAGVFVVSAIIFAITWEPLFSRFTQISQEFTAERARLVIYEDTLRIFSHYPISGTGAGTFSQVFPMHRSFTTNDFYRHAHNDYLQLLSETGIFGLLFLIAMLYTFVSRLWEIVSRTPGKVMLIQIGAACGLIGFGLHSMTEFGAQIPAVMMTAVILSTTFWRTPIVQENEI